ncbi:MAG: DnaJ domain-containing protein [Myxococcota bacterium]
MARHVLLIVVIDAEQRARFNAVLERTRHHVVFAFDADDGLVRFLEAKPDLILTAERLPSARGTRFLSRLRALAGGSEIPVVVFGSGDQVVPHADGRLSYPFDRRTLLSTIAPLLAYGRPEPEGQPPADARTLVGYQNPFVASEGTEQELPSPPAAVPSGTSPPPVNPEPEAPTMAGQVIAEADREPWLREEPLPNPEELTPTADPISAADLDLEPEVVEPTPEFSPHPFEAEEEPIEAPEVTPRPLEGGTLPPGFVERVRSVHARLERADYYELLEVQRGDDEDRIHAAWFDLALELHPDRFFLQPSGELKAMIYRIYRQLSEAHDVLSDPARRFAYDRRRRSGGTIGVSGGPAPSGESKRLEIVVHDAAAAIFAERAEEAFAREAIDDARTNLQALLACEPDNASAKRALEVLEARLGPTV